MDARLQIIRGLQRHFADLQDLKELANWATDFTEKYNTDLIASQVTVLRMNHSNSGGKESDGNEKEEPRFPACCGQAKRKA